MQTGYSIHATADACALTVLLASFLMTCSPPPAALITWEKTFGGSSFERAYAIEQTRDSGYIIAGQTSSFGAGGYDFYIIKADELGNRAWEKTFGGSSSELPRSIRQTSDGGYIIAGRSSSFKTGYCDFYIIRLDQDGTKTWEKVYGGDTWDDPFSIQQTDDGGYIVAGYTDSIGYGGNDAYVIRIDSSGGMLWNRTYGGTGNDSATSIQQTADGGYIVAGHTESSGAGSSDAYVLKLDSNGTAVWEQTYGGTGYDSAEMIRQTADEGYVFAGYTDSSGAGGTDMLVVRIDAVGAVLWERTYGGLNDDQAKAVQQTGDGNYVLCGYIGSADFTDMYLAKLGNDGDILWERTYGGTYDDAAYDIRQTRDGGYVIAGYTHPPDASASYDDDMYILKLNRQGTL